jgi:hypothetical protein
MPREVRVVYDRIANVLDELNAICDLPGATKFIDRDYAIGSLAQVMTHLREAVPTKDCWCCGTRGCRVCHGTGTIPLQVWLRRPAEAGGGE